MEHAQQGTIGRSVDADMASNSTRSDRIGMSSSEATFHKIDAASTCSCNYHSIAPESRCESDISSCSCNCSDCHVSSSHHPPCMSCTGPPSSSCSASENCHARPVSVPHTITIDTKNRTDELPMSIFSLYTSSQKKKRRWCRSRLCVIGSFILFILGGLLGFFCWPRTPLVSIASTGVELEKAQLEAPAGFHSTWLVNLTLDNRENWVPLQISDFQLVMHDSLTRQKFAWSAMDGLVLQPRTINTVAAVFHVDYSAAQSTDPTFQNLREACTKPPSLINNTNSDLASATSNSSSSNDTSSDITSSMLTATSTPPIHIVLHVVFHFFAFVWAPALTVTPETGSFICPG